MMGYNAKVKVIHKFCSNQWVSSLGVHIQDPDKSQSRNKWFLVVSSGNIPMARRI